MQDQPLANGVITASGTVTLRNSAIMRLPGILRQIQSPDIRRLCQGHRLIQCLSSRQIPTTQGLSLFVPSSGTLCGTATLTTSVSTGTTQVSASRDANGFTGVAGAHGHTQGVNAQHTHQISTEVFTPLPRILSPINVDVLKRYLESYPCPGTRDYLVSGFRYGFDIGFRGTFTDPNTRPRNLRSALDNADLVTEAILKELSRGHTSGPFPYPPFPHTHCSLIGSAPKPDGS